MTLEQTDLSTLVSDADLTELHTRATAVRDGMTQVQAAHPGYNWAWTDEIRCRGKECGASLDIPPLRSNTTFADNVFADHQQKHLQLILNESPWPND